MCEAIAPKLSAHEGSSSHLMPYDNLRGQKTDDACAKINNIVLIQVPKIIYDDILKSLSFCPMVIYNTFSLAVCSTAKAKENNLLAVMTLENSKHDQEWKIKRAHIHYDVKWLNVHLEDVQACEFGSVCTPHPHPKHTEWCPAETITEHSTCILCLSGRTAACSKWPIPPLPHVTPAPPPVHSQLQRLDPEPRRDPATPLVSC